MRPEDRLHLEREKNEATLVEVRFLRTPFSVYAKMMTMLMKIMIALIIKTATLYL